MMILTIAFVHSGSIINIPQFKFVKFVFHVAMVTNFVAKF